MWRAGAALRANASKRLASVTVASPWPPALFHRRPYDSSIGGFAYVFFFLFTQDLTAGVTAASTTADRHTSDGKEMAHVSGVRSVDEMTSGSSFACQPGPLEACQLRPAATSSGDTQATTAGSLAVPSPPPRVRSGGGAARAKWMGATRAGMQGCKQTQRNTSG